MVSCPQRFASPIADGLPTHLSTFNEWTTSKAAERVQEYSPREAHGEVQWRRCIIWSVYLNRYRSLLTINQPVCVANRWGECLTTIWILARQTLNRRKLNKGWWYKEGIPTTSVILCSWGWMNEWMTVLIYCEWCVVKLIVILQHNLIIILCPGWSWPRVRTDSLERSR